MTGSSNASINTKRKAVEMESNQPEELQAAKVQRTESVERKYQK